MSSRLSPFSELAQRLREQVFLRSLPGDLFAEAGLYHRRACIAAAEERYDVALVFCQKALAIQTDHLATRLLVARIYDRGLSDLEKAVAAYNKVIALSGYDGSNPFCAAAREALDLMVTARIASPGTRS
jgi:tetratricopeptide (TPR) repeat protein